MNITINKHSKLLSAESISRLEILLHSLKDEVFDYLRANHITNVFETISYKTEQQNDTGNVSACVVMELIPEITIIKNNDSRFENKCTRVGRVESENCSIECNITKVIARICSCTDWEHSPHVTIDRSMCFKVASNELSDILTSQGQAMAWLLDTAEEVKIPKNTITDALLKV